MENRETDRARQYHRRTNHSLASVQANARMLDIPNMPLPYKIYTTLDPIPLPRDLPPSSVPAVDAIVAVADSGTGERLPDLAALARLCLLSNGITKRLQRGQRTIDFRAAATTGALYHIELYLVCGDLPDLPAGLYHYGAHDHSLRRLRSGDFRETVSTATGLEPSVASAPVTIICTSTFWRNAWKYEARAYRHSYWDGGTVLANLLAEAAALDLPTEVVLGFTDEQINRLIDVDPDKEAAISLVAVGKWRYLLDRAPDIQPLNLPTEQLSPDEVDYPDIPAMHRASSLANGNEVFTWRQGQPAFAPRLVEMSIPLQPTLQSDLPDDPIEAVIRRRGSTRQFTRDPITFAQLSTILERSTHGVPADAIQPRGTIFNDLYLIVNAVEGLPNGTYVYQREPRTLGLLQEGNFREDAGYLDLGQELGADAAVNCYFLIDLEPMLAAFGNRGYRVAQLEAAITAGRIYLASYALRLGASGLTFFDDDVTAFFSPHSAGKSVMFLVALGHPFKRRS